ncbi:MAG: response regulator [Deltaproteobacteria bacterium]|nr:response regulator [Deltaproteobacteria bacterium]
MEAGENILIVDDDGYVRDTLISILETGGYRTFEAASHEAALGVLDTEFIDLVITDLKLPDKSGFDLLEYIRETQQGLDTILITGFGDVDTAASAIEKEPTISSPNPFTPIACSWR